MYRLLSREFSVLSHPSSTFTKHQTPPRCKAVSLQSRRSLAVQTWTGRSGSGSGSRAEFEHTRYWESFATWWQLLGEKERDSRTGGKPGGQSRRSRGRIPAEGLAIRAVPAHTHIPAQAPGSGQHHPSPSSARHSWHSPCCPASSLASQLECVPEPRARITVRQHSAFCNLMLLYPNLFSWKKTKACRFYDVNPQILGV